MNTLVSRLLWTAILLLSAFALSACGGGGGDDRSDPLLDVHARVNGQFLPDVHVLDGTRQAIVVLAGQNIELEASRPVTWTVSVGGNVIAGTGNTISSGGIRLVETLITDFRFIADTFLFAPGIASLQVTVVANSLEFPGATAVIDLVVTR